MRATRLIAHRGPDDEGFALIHTDSREMRAFSSDQTQPEIEAKLPTLMEEPAFEHNLGLGFRRFSIVDLTTAGHQPFWSRDRKVVLTFNGEIYNYVELRQQLESQGYIFRTRCDTEVLLATYELWPDTFLEKFNGPLALALYDGRKGKLILARDRIGKNPLYYAFVNNTLYWASEIRSIRSLTPDGVFEINKQAAYDYLRYGFRDLDNTTFWNSIRTLPAACQVSIDAGQKTRSMNLEKSAKRYWFIPTSRLTKKDISFSSACAEFDNLLTDAVRIRARADAKVAFSLSGGMDSSSLVALAVGELGQNITSYTVKIDDPAGDEEPFARSLYEMYPGKIDYRIHHHQNRDFWQVADEFVSLLEEPYHFANSHVFQAYFHSAYERGFRVMVIGAGGDELLGGYDHCFNAYLRALVKRGDIPGVMKNLFLRRKSNSWDDYRLISKVRQFAGLLMGRGKVWPKDRFVSLFNPFGKDTCHKYLKSISEFGQLDERQGYSTDFEQMLIDMMTNWLMNYWQRNSNRSHFGVPVEPRSPFLDYRLIDYTYQLPIEYLIDRGWSKYLLRKSIEPLLPRRIVWRRQKMGFPFNNRDWFLSCKPMAAKHFEDVKDNPYVDYTSVIRDYEKLLETDVMLLWRFISFALWWKKIIAGKTLLSIL